MHVEVSACICMVPGLRTSPVYPCFFCGLAGKCYCHPPSRIGGKSTTMQIKGGFPKNYLTRFRQHFHVAFHTLDLRLTPAVYIDSFALNFLPSVFALSYSFIAGSIPRFASFA